MIRHQSLRRPSPVRRLLALAALSAAACGGPPSFDPGDVTIYSNARVVTVDDDFNVHEAFAVAGDRFVAVGTTEEVLDAVGDSAPLVDLGGRTVLPGFNDNHIHLGPGRTLQEWRGGLIPGLPEWSAKATTMPELRAALAEEVSSRPAGEWVLGGLTRMDWPNDRIPTRWQLDSVAPNHPVMLTRGPHTYILNSLALSLAGIDRDTPDPEGGWIFRDDGGEPNGRVLEAARRIVDRALPPEAHPIGGYEEGIEDMRRYLEQLVGLGITSVNVAGVRPSGMAAVRDLYEQHADRLPRATVQVRLRPGHDIYDDLDEGIRTEIDALEALSFTTGYGDDRFKVGAIKMSIDGGLSAPLFWSLEPYPGRPGFTGAVRIPADVFRPVAERAHELGWQLGIHVMGDAAARMVVREIAGILDRNPRPDHRHYLHHVAVKPPDETIVRMAANDIMVASQPSFTVGLGAYAKEALSPEREATQNPTRSLLDAGVMVSYGSDSAPYGPMITIWTAVTRIGHNGRVYGQEESVPVEEAIRLHTRAPAYFTFDEAVKGQIATEMLADFIVLSDNPLVVPPESLRDITVERVFIGGMEVGL